MSEKKEIKQIVARVGKRKLPPDTMGGDKREAQRQGTLFPQFDEPLQENEYEEGLSNPASVESLDEFSQNTASTGANTSQTEPDDSLCKISGYTASDVELLDICGFDGDVIRIFGEKRLNDFNENEMLKGKPLQTSEIDRPFGCVGDEDIKTEDKPSIQKTFSKQKGGLMLGVCLLTVLFAVSSLFHIFYVNPSEPLNLLFFTVAPRYFPICDGLLLLLATPFIRRFFVGGLKGAFSYAANSFTVPSVLTIISFLYLAFVFVDNGVVFVPLVSFVLFSYLVQALVSFSRLNVEKKMYDFVSSPGDKYTLEQNDYGKRRVKKEGKLVRIVNETGRTSMLSVVKTKKVSGYFRRLSQRRHGEYYIIVAVSLLLPLFCILFSVLVGMATGNSLSLSELFSRWAKLLMVSCPVSISFFYVHPYNKMNRILLKEKCCLIGDGIDDFGVAGNHMILLPDDMLFKASIERMVNVKQNDLTNRYHRMASKLFYLLGGTLAKTFGTTNEELGNQVRLLRVESNGVEAMVDGDHCLCGNEAFLRRMNIETHLPTTEIDSDKSLMYFCVNSEICLVYLLAYESNHENDELLTFLTKCGVPYDIVSNDPNMNAAFSQLVRPTPGHPLRVVKLNKAQDRQIHNVIDSAVVSLTHGNVVLPLMATQKIKKSREAARWMQIGLSTLGCLALTSLQMMQSASSFTLSGVCLFHAMTFALMQFVNETILTDDQLKKQERK